MNSAAAAPRVPAYVRPYLRALWPAEPPAVALLPSRADRPVLAAGTLYLPRGITPPAWEGASDPLAGAPDPRGEARLRLATAAHAGAHRAHGGPRFERATLRPVQLALVGLLEDARVEWLAARELPGLRALWLGFHTAGPGDASDFETLMARLARVLLDPCWHDPHPWVLKGRALFFADAEGGRLGLRDAAALRSAASRLGNDIGQMRLQFDARQYRVQPAYRDDNSHLWAFDDALPPSALLLDAQEAPARSGGAAEDGVSREEAGTPAVGAERAATVDAASGAEAAPAARAFVYPEWDRLISRHRPRWVTVLEGGSNAKPAPGATQRLRALLEAHAGLERRLRLRLHCDGALRSRARPRRALEGDAFLLPALVDAAVAKRMQASPDPRVFLRPETGADPWAVLLLIDASASTARAAGPGRAVAVTATGVSGVDPAGPAGASVLDRARLAALACAAAFESAGHRCAVRAFASDGRHAVRIGRVKDFDDRNDDPAVLERAAALESGLSTRIGAALRHAAAEAAQRPEARRCVLLLTDGEPHDVDVHDSRYLLEDLRVAVSEARRRGIAVGCLDLDAGAPAGRREALRRVFPAGACRAVPRLEALPETLLAVLAGARG